MKKTNLMISFVLMGMILSNHLPATAEGITIHSNLFHVNTNGNENPTEVIQSERVENMPLIEMAKRDIIHLSKTPKSTECIFSDDAIITTAPSGETTHYYRNTTGYYMYWGGYIVFGKPATEPVDIVYGDDGFAYIHNPFGGFTTNSYLKCEIQDNKLVATLPQAIYEEDGETPDGDFIHIDCYANLLYNIGDQENPEYVTTDADVVQTISWTIDDKGNLIMDMEYDDTLDEEGYPQLPDVIFGMVDADGIWRVAGDCVQQYEKVDLNPVVIPDGLETNDWALIFNGAGHFVNVGFDGDNVYLNNLDSTFPDAYVKGKVEGDKVIFESGQYLGTIEGQAYMFFMGGTYDADMDIYYLADNITFDYDTDKKIMTASEGKCMFINASLDVVYYLSMFVEPVIKLRNPNPDPIPSHPIPDFYLDYFQEYDYTFIKFNLPAITHEGDLLDTNNMYYEVYIDEELMTFDMNDYVMFDEDMTQIPYNFTDYNDIFIKGSAHSIYFYFGGYDTVGLRQYHVFDGKTYASPLTIWNVLEDSYYIDDTPVSIEAFVSDDDIISIEYYTLQGVKLSQPATGINICRTIRKDGSNKVAKILVK